GIYVQSMAESFAKILGDDFLFIVRGEVPESLSKQMKVMGVKAGWRLRRGYYFLWIPINIFRSKWFSSEYIFLSTDPYLLAILIFWRRIFRLKYKVSSDWHQMFDDWRDMYVASGSDVMFATSERLKSLLIKKCHVPEERIVVAYGGVDTSLFHNKSSISKEELRRKLELREEDFLVGFIGAFKSMGLLKGLDTMIKVLPLIDPAIKVVLVGARPLETRELGELANTLRVSNRAIVIPYQHYEQVVEYELAMDVLVIPYPDLPHFRDYGFPMKVWEYMATGVPIVYSNLGIMREVLDGHGTPFTPSDEHSLAKVINHMHTNYLDVKKIASKNRELVRNYSWDSRADTIIKTIKNN
ncbi:glycosyltransferase family 4 protein, partial [Candidatus Parcubacteria bacterium]|nr:glycosyltransferase family 4 protein [Candidatus Parcubacteria bacterium]